MDRRCAALAPSRTKIVTQWLSRLFLMALLYALAASPSQAQNLASEFAIKATYLYKFAPFVGWPPEAFAITDAPLNICVIGEDPFGRILDDAVGSQTFAGRHIEIRRFLKLAGAQNCHIVFAAGSAAQSVAKILDETKGSPVLTITDGTQQGPKGIINFVIVEKRVRFEIDISAAKQNNLKISSKLLDLAVSTGGRTP